jgi:hypothetical protein
METSIVARSLLLEGQLLSSVGKVHHTIEVRDVKRAVDAI